MTNGKAFRHTPACVQSILLNPLADVKFLNLSETEAFSENNFSVVQVMQFLLANLENIVKKKGENAGYQHFLLFPQCFQKTLFLMVVESMYSLVMSQ